MNRTSNAQAGDYIAGHHDFQGSNLRGTWDGGGYGRLPDEQHEAFRLIKSEAAVYTVYSYETPIAWWSSLTGWIVPPVKYSPTTSHHQGIVVRAITHRGVESIAPERRPEVCIADCPGLDLWDCECAECHRLQRAANQVLS